MGRRRPLPNEGVPTLLLGGTEGAADFSDATLGVGAFVETCTVAGDEFASAGTDMAAGKLGRQASWVGKLGRIPVLRLGQNRTHSICSLEIWLVCTK